MEGARRRGARPAVSCVLVVGGGGREHALAWALSRSRRVDRLLVAPGNPGTAACDRTENVAVAAGDVAGLVALCRRESVDLAVIGPEDPLAAGVVDALASAGVAAFGPSASCARLEASKAHCKRFLIDNGIPTAAAEVFGDPDAALAHLTSRPDVPVVSVNGDCAFGFNAMEMETAVRYQLPIVFIINNNSGIVGGSLEANMGLPEGYEERVATYTPEIRYDKILEAFGGHTEHVTEPSEINAALRRAYQATQEGKVACVNVISEPWEVARSGGSRGGSLMGYDR